MKKQSEFQQCILFNKAGAPPKFVHPKHLQQPIHQSIFINDINMKERYSKMNTGTTPQSILKFDPENFYQQKPYTVLCIETRVYTRFAFMKLAYRI